MGKGGKKRKLPQDSPPEDSTKVVDKRRKPSKPVTCSVCMETSTDIKTIGHCMICTPCGHIFCCLCLASFVRGYLAPCPVCRAQVNKDKVYILRL